MSSVIPIETERLLLREGRDADASAWADSLADPEFRRYIPWRRSDEALEARASRNIAALMARWDGEPLTSMGWVITRKHDGAIVGTGGVDASEDPADGELDYFLGRAYWGLGYGTEAAHAMARFALAHTSIARLIAYIVPANTGSIRIAEGMGMQFEGVVDYLQFFPDPSIIELSDPMTNLYAVRREDVRLRDAAYRELDATR